MDETRTGMDQRGRPIPTGSVGSMRGSERPSDRPRSRQAIPSDVIDAARKNFLRYGVNRTTMADIARAVGTPRQTLYDYVSSKGEVIDAVIVHRINEIAEGLQPVEDDAAPFMDAFIEISVAAICRARDDHELMNIVATGPIDRVQDIIAGTNPEIHDIVAHLLDPILDRALQTGLLRTDRTRDGIIDWVRIVYLSLISQTSIEPDKIRELIEGFLAPSIMSSPDNHHQPRAPVAE
jgi:AcrR family transcriptional regulator